MDITRLREYRVRGQKLPLLPPPPLLPGTKSHLLINVYASIDLEFPNT